MRALSKNLFPLLLGTSKEIFTLELLRSWMDERRRGEDLLFIPSSEVKPQPGVNLRQQASSHDIS